MNNFLESLIGCSPDFIRKQLQDKGYNVVFTYTKGFKDQDLLTEEYAVRINCTDETCNVILSCFKTMI